MARFTVMVPDDLLMRAEDAIGVPTGVRRVNRSRLVQVALARYADEQEGSRPETSGRGKTETLRALRAARAALDDVEATLTQGKPVRRRVRRV